MVSDALVEAVWGGGYPEALARTAPRRRTAWARQYLQALVQRDVRDVASIDRLGPVAAFVASLGENAGGQLVGVEIKSAASVTAGILRGLKRLASVAGDPFEMGVVLTFGPVNFPVMASAGSAGLERQPHPTP